MAVTLDDFKQQINADSLSEDDDKALQGMLESAEAFVQLYVDKYEDGLTEQQSKAFDKLVDRAILEYAAALYLSRDGAPNSTSVKSDSSISRQSLDLLLDFLRNVPV